MLIHVSERKSDDTWAMLEIGVKLFYYIFSFYAICYLICQINFVRSQLILFYA